MPVLKKMNISITPRTTRNKQKIYYTMEWGKNPGEHLATGIFTYTHPVGDLQKRHNKEAVRFLQIRKAQMIIDGMAIGALLY